MRLMTAAAMLVFSGGFAFSQTPAQPVQQKTEVRTMTLSPEDVPVIVRANGRVVAVNDAQIIPRASGQVMGLMFSAGERVSAGQGLVKLDDDTQKADVAVAESALESAQADVPPAEASLRRERKLLGSGTTQESLDSAESALLRAKAAVKSAEAQLITARINLERTTIRAPFDGVMGEPSVSVGDYVASGQSDGVGRITSLSPVWADLRTSSFVSPGSPSSEMSVTYVTDSGDVIERGGRVVSVGGVVDASSGTVLTRTIASNEDGALKPGAFVSGEITIGHQTGYLVPQDASTPDASGGVQVWVLSEGKAKKVIMPVSGSHDGKWTSPAKSNASITIIVDHRDTLFDGADVASKSIGAE